MATRVLVVSNNLETGWKLGSIVESGAPRTLLAGVVAAEEALYRAKASPPHVILVDLGSRPRTAIDLVAHLHRASAAKIVIYCREHSRRACDDAVIKGARGVIGSDDDVFAAVEILQRVRAGELCIDPFAAARIIDRLAGPRPAPGSNRTGALTLREREVVRYVVGNSGAPYKRVAEMLRIEDGTLRNHLSLIYRKLKVSNRSQLTLYAAQQAEI
jgi:DNA-binding NarL/FixJ family response regulator